MEMHTFPDPAFKKKVNVVIVVLSTMSSNLSALLIVDLSIAITVKSKPELICNTPFAEHISTSFLPSFAGCHEGKQCTCKECPDKSAGKSKCKSIIFMLCAFIV
ncbi:unnamed protein product [Brugia timori]|uniref:G_PROTEIN_RECEP_F1_2 domain-containing protein n=1 Tax=Brugia timori TaxID=42155 RepID=A0A0R3QRI1_9BILA|nr:unnamed protein product [Brugia timori]